MKFRLLAVLLLTAPSVFGQTSNTSASQQAVDAMKILDGWHAEAPEPGRRSLHLVCWTPSDRELPEDYEGRLTRMMKHIQNFYRREMERLGLGPRTFHLNFKNDGLLVLHTVKGTHATEHYAVQSGTEIRRECLPALKQAGIEPDRETILILCNLATWDAEKLRFTHKSPYYAGGSYRSGTAWQLDSPELDPLNLSLKKPIIRDGQYGRISLGKHNSIFIGGVAHELGHALGLPHCKARPDEAVRGTALMGSGNRTYGDEIRGDGRGSFLTLAHGLRLASHPQFSGSLKGLPQRAMSEISDLSVNAAGKSIRVSGAVTGTPPVYAVVAYFDPEGGGDYDARTATAVPTAEGRFSLSCDALPPGKSGQLRLFPLHANGSAAAQMSRTRFRYSYSIDNDGLPNLETIQLKQQLQPVIAAVLGRHREQAKKLATELKQPRAAVIARQLTDPPTPTLSPADWKGEAVEMPLTEFKLESVKVGWGQPAFNRVPDDSLLLESGGQIFEAGIYAHAPSRHVYDVGRKWTSFHGTVGLAAGHDGTVQFEIKGDGRSLWKSKTVKSGGVVEFDVNMDDVEQLELLTNPTADGAGADWGLWLNPTIAR